MTITAVCDSCGRQYQAPVALAGKSVKCKGCGAVFVIRDFTDPVDVPAVEPEVDLNALADLESQHFTPFNDVAAGMGGNVGTTVMPSPVAADDELPNAPKGRKAGRINVRFRYAYSKQVDLYLPIVLTVGAIALLVWQNIRLNETTSDWIPGARSTILLIAFALFVFPLSFVGIKSTGMTMYSLK